MSAPNASNTTTSPINGGPTTLKSTNTYLPGAREKTLGHLFGRNRGRGLNLVASESEQFFGDQVLDGRSGKVNQLEYPLTLGTDKHSHIIVFHIYNEIEAGMGNITNEDLTIATMGTAKQTMYGYAGGAGAATVGFFGTKSALKNVNLRGGNPAKLGISLGAGIGSFLLGQYTAEALVAVFGAITDEEKTAMAKINQYEEAQDKKYREQADDYFEATGRTARLGRAIHRSKDTIAMYMPQKIQSLSLVEYEQQDLSFMQNLMNSWTGLAAAGILKKAPGVIDSLAGFLGMNTNIDTYIQATARIAPNPRKQLLFREPVSRKFEFVFNFSPRNEEESVRAYEIIQAFKKHAYPTLNQKIGAGAFYTFPAEFEIQYQMLLPTGEIVENNWINRIGRSALREINVDYASAGSYSTFPNGAPTNMTMSLTFEEMSLLDQEHINQGY